MCFSATDALKGEGLQEGVDWLQGMMRVDMNESESGRCVMSCAHSDLQHTVQWWNVTRYIYSVTVLEYKFKVLVLSLRISI